MKDKESKQRKINIFWFRRDLRLFDNIGLKYAHADANPLVHIFIFDKNILNDLDKDDLRVAFIYKQVEDLKKAIEDGGGVMKVFYNTPDYAWKELIDKYNVEKVFFNRDYEPYAKRRDLEIEDLLKKNGAKVESYKDHVIFESNEILKKDGTPYTVFTPYKKRWLEKFESSLPESDPRVRISEKPAEISISDMPSLNEIGFEESSHQFPSMEVPSSLIKNYSAQRDYPGLDTTSKLGIHFRFGTISIRQKAVKAKEISPTYLNELIWRDFYSMILDSFPFVEHRCFKEKYENIFWRNSKEEIKLWETGMTGYPMVDAGMRQLNNTGFMHNRVRMIVASFLTKHLLVDWRIGEAYFAQKLLDYELASNNGGWQWAAGCGTDSAPYFRIFNPTSQMEKFDKDKKYIMKWIPEYGTEKYPQPMVDHKYARERCLTTYRSALSN